ncbi:MAG TPA: WD40 repeat domain-containing protein [Chthoniobacterales bacterium]|nr:WD40 repeat domain-containing protein [Chthoniobacterales bacterium]
MSFFGIHLLFFASAFQCRAEKLGDLRSIYNPSFNQDGSRVIVGRESGVVQIWEVTTGKMVVGDVGQRPGTSGFLVSADGRRLVTGFTDGHSRVFDATTGKPLSPLLDLQPTFEHSPWALFSPDGATLLIFGEREAVLFNIATGKRLATIPMGKAEDMQIEAGSARFAAGGALCFVLNSSGQVTRYDTKDGKPIGKPIQHPPADSAMDFFLAVSDDGKWLTTFDSPGENGPKGNLQVWDVGAEKPLGEPITAMNGLAARFLANNRVLVMPERGSESDGMNVYNLPSMKVAYTLRGPDDVDRAKTETSPDGKWLLTWATYAADRRLDLFDTETGKLAGALHSHVAISAVYMAPDSSGCYVAFDNSPFEEQGYHDYYVMKLHFPEMKITQSLRLTDNVSRIALSPDGKRFVVAHGEKDKERLFFYDAATLKPLK